MSNEYKDWLNDLTDTQRKNLELCNKYPILIPTNSEDYDYEYTWLDEIEDGWRFAFGEEWAKEIQEFVNQLPEDEKDEVEIRCLKEKFGVFRQYFTKYPEGISNIIDKYEKISRETCIKCGKPATKISLGWISPWCDDCANNKGERYLTMTEYYKEMQDNV